MPRHEDVSEDPVIIEAIVCLKASIRSLAPVYEATHSPELWRALEDVYEAIRLLEGKEDP